MSKAWSLVPLGQVVLPVERAEVPTSGKVYRQIGVRLWGAGAYEREAIDGAQTKYQTLSRVETDDIIVNKIWARNGSVAVVSEALAGCYGSNEFPTFAPIREKLAPRWFHWLTKTKNFWEQCDEKSRGTSGKNRIRPERFLEIEIPLPPLPEQRRIVARIEELAAKIEEARGLRREAVEEIEALTQRTKARLFDSDRWQKLPLGSLLREESRNGLSPRPSDMPPGIPILRISAATSRSDDIVDESDIRYLRVSEKEAEQYKLEPGDLLACRFNGNLHYVGKFALYRGTLNEPRIYPDKLIRFRVDPEKTLPDFVRYAVNSPKGRSSVEAFCATTAGNIGISASNLRTVPIPIPSLSEQRRIVTYLDNLHAKVDALKRLQTETAAELNALLPSVLDKAFKGEL
ncbi:MAG: restriction endonuclease subunit S [Candidatus Binatia bacterium]